MSKGFTSFVARVSAMLASLWVLKQRTSEGGNFEGCSWCGFFSRCGAVWCGFTENLIAPYDLVISETAPHRTLGVSKNVTFTLQHRTAQQIVSALNCTFRVSSKHKHSQAIGSYTLSSPLRRGQGAVPFMFPFVYRLLPNCTAPHRTAPHCIA